MNTYIPTRDELQESIKSAVEEAVTSRLPEIIRKATAKEFYTISETCQILDCTRRHLQYLRDSGQVNYIKNGKKVFFRAKDLEKFFDKNYIQQTDQVNNLR